MNWRAIFKRRHKSNRPELNCRLVATLLMEYLNEETDPVTTASIDRHLQECVNCRHFLESYRKTAQLVGKIEYEEIPAEFTQRLEETLRMRLKSEGHAD